MKKIFTFPNSGPKIIEGFTGFVLAELRTKTPLLEVYKSDCRNNYYASIKDPREFQPPPPHPFFFVIRGVRAKYNSLDMHFCHLEKK